MNNHIVLEDDPGIRMGKKQCIYCGSKIGEFHKYECVTLTKKVKVKYSFYIEIDVPQSWDKDQIEYSRNEGRWCADNSLTEIELYRNSKNTCLCNFFECEVLSDEGDK